MASQQSEKDDNATQIQSSERNFRENELGDLINALHSISHRAVDLGIQLGIMYDKIKEIEEEYRKPSRQLNEILYQRLKLGPFSLQSLLKALRSPSVREDKLASEIETKFSQSVSVTLQASPANTANPVTTSASAPVAPTNSASLTPHLSSLTSPFSHPLYPQHITELSNTANASVMTQSDMTRARYCADQLPPPQQCVRAQNPYIPPQPPFQYHQSETGNQLPFYNVRLPLAPVHVGIVLATINAQKQLFNVFFLIYFLT